MRIIDQIFSGARWTTTKLTTNHDLILNHDLMLIRLKLSSFSCFDKDRLYTIFLFTVDFLKILPQKADLQTC